MRMVQSPSLRSLRAIQIRHHLGVEVSDFPRIEKVVKLLAEKRPGSMLDIGYSRGSFADALSGQCWKCVGVDLNPWVTEGIELIQCDLNEGVPFKAEAFDLVTAGEVIEHVFDELSFLREIFRVLKKGGWLALTTPNLCFSLNRILVPLGRMPMFAYAPYHYHFYTLKTLVSLIEQHGFEVLKVSSSHVLYSRRRHPTGKIFEWLADLFPTLGAHLIVIAARPIS